MSTGLRQVFVIFLLLVPAFPLGVLAFQNQQPIPSRPSGAFKDLARYRKDPAFNYREKPPEMSVLDRVISWIYRLLFHTTYKVASSSWTWRIFQGVCLACLLFVIYKLLSLEKFGLFRKKDKLTGHAFSGDEKNFHEADFRRAIALALESQDYRNAVRLWYLQTLRDLSDRHIINWSLEKTNTAYLQETRAASQALYDPFARLTYAFEYTFYGSFDIKEETYQGIEHDFLAFTAFVASNRETAL